MAESKPATKTIRARRKKGAAKPAPKASRQILINMEAPDQCRVALLENGRLEAFDLETLAHSLSRGNIYKGRLTNIEPSLQAVFVEIGMSRNAYLPFDEIHPEYYGYAEDRDRLPDLLTKGQDLMVQVVKEPTPIKGVAVTTYLSIPGRYLVLMPGTEHVGVSRKIEDDTERIRLKEILKIATLPDTVGLIARTASEGVPKKEIQKDLKYLLRLWQDLRKKVRTTPAPCLVYRDRDVVTRFLRDYLTNDVQEILVDRQKTYDAIRAFLKLISPRHVATVHLHAQKEPIFSLFNLETQIDQIYESRVELPSGGSIFIEPTEALVAVDVNSGRNIREKDLEETALKTNLEAAEEIGRQLRLRDLGGLIVIDFIDMRSRAYRQDVERRLRESLKKDRARTEISRISRFGLLEMVRQKIRAPVQLGSYRSCPCCQGRGMVRSVESLGLAFLRHIRAGLASEQTSKVQQVLLQAPPPVASYLLNRKRSDLHRLEETFSVKIYVEASPRLGLEEHTLSLSS